MVSSRIWSTTEVDALVVAANLLGAAVKRNRMDSLLQNELEKRKSLIDELESKNQELERFTYTVSHDLKSPLFTIRGFLGYLEQDASSGNRERLTADVQRISDATDKMQRLLNDLLELSRIGRMMNESSTVPFDEILKEAVELVEGRLKEYRVTLRIEENLPAVYGDRPRLVEVLQNLLDNAAKFMGSQPEPQIEIGSVGDVTQRRQSTFFVRDNGIGIAPEHFERIFGLFNKLEPRSEGTGIGLALVKRIIEVHGGRIWVESEAGQGTTFFFTLPTQPPQDSVI
jgi:signal transduction histidine kinase